MTLILSAVLLGWLLERWIPLRVRRDPAPIRRIFVNAVVATSSYWISKWSAAALLVQLAWWAEDHQFGLLPQLAKLWGADELVLGVVGFLLLDWSVYAWHRLMHTWTPLWHFHRVHHADLDMDSTTALRFHFGEFFFSNLYRVGQILVIGVPVPLLVIFELAITYSAIFHHSNLRLPGRLDQVLSRFMATPRIHSIHHSQEVSETRSNYGSLLMLWDRLHRSWNIRRLEQIDAIVIGDAEWSTRELTGVVSTLLLPFRACVKQLFKRS